MEKHFQMMMINIRDDDSDMNDILLLQLNADVYMFLFHSHESYLRFSWSSIIILPTPVAIV